VKPLFLIFPLSFQGEGFTLKVLPEGIKGVRLRKNKYYTASSLLTPYTASCRIRA
jgi:hypothetical protein